MNKLLLSMMAAAAVLGGCSNDDDKNNSGQVTDKDLITPELARMAVSTTSSFTGALTVLPCQDNSSIYYGNYNANGTLTPVNATYVILNGSIAKSPMPVRLPVGDSPLLTIRLTLEDGLVKTYSKPLSAPLAAGNRMTLNITLGKLIVEGGSDSFDVENWTESSETIDFS